MPLQQQQPHLMSCQQTHCELPRSLIYAGSFTGRVLVVRRLDGLGGADLTISDIDAAGASLDSTGPTAKRKRSDEEFEHG